MSSPDNSATGKGEDVVREDDENGKPAPEEPSRKNDSPPPSNGDQPSGLPDDLERESSEEEVLLSPDKREAASISGGDASLEDCPSTPKKVKQDIDFSGLQESHSASLDSKASGSDPAGSSSLKKDQTSSDPLLLSPDRKESSSTSRDFRTPEKQTSRETDVKSNSPILLKRLQGSTLSTLRDQSASNVPPNASVGQSTLLQDADLTMVLLPEKLSPLRDPPESNLSNNASGQSAQSQGPSYKPGETNILLGYLGKPPLIPSLSSAGTNAPTVFNPSEGNRECVSEIVKSNPGLVGLLTQGVQKSCGTQGATGLNITPQTSGYPSTSIPKDELVSSDPSTGTKKPPGMQEMDDSSEDGGSEDYIGSEELPRSPVKPAEVADGTAMDIDDDNASGLPSVDAPLAESESSSDLDETPQISKQTRSSSRQSKNASSADASGVSSQPDSQMNISPEDSLDADTLTKNSKRTGRMQTRSDNLESIKQGDSSKVATPGRKSKPLPETKKSSRGETSSSADQSVSSAREVPPAVDPDDKVFKKPSAVTPLRLQKMKSRLEDINLDDSSATNSPSRRSARIQSKESGESVKESSLEKEGKNLRSRTGGRAVSDEGTKAASGEKSKSLSRERISKLKAESGGSRSESMERSKPKTRSREDTKKREQSGSRGHTSSEESVASRTRGSRLASNSSNSETEKPEDEESETPRRLRKSRKDSGK